VKSFSRAIFQSFRYRWSILGAVLCSMGVALLWCASLTTIYPVLQVVLENKTAESWAEAEIVRCNERIVGNQETLERLEAKISQEGDSDQPAERASDLYQIGFNKKQIGSEEKAREWYESTIPWFRDYAPSTPFGTLAWAIIFLMIITAIKGVLLVISAILVARASNRTVMDMRRIYYCKALNLDQRRIDGIGTANMMTHLTHNMIMVSGGLQVFYGKMLREPLKMIACLAGAAYICTPLLLLSLFVVPAGALLISSLSRRMKRATQREIEGMSSVYQTLIETMGSLRTVRVFGREIRERRRFKSNSGSLYRMSVRISLYDSLIRPITEVLGIVSISASILAGAWLVLNQQTELFGIHISDRPMEPMSLLLFYSMLAGASDPARKMSEIINILVRGGTACETLERTFDVDPLVNRPENPVPVPVHCKSIQIKDISFAYLPKQPVLQRLSLEVPFGQTIAIVGENGCGKSTLMSLLLRFYDPFTGHIMIDGVNIRDCSPRQVRKQFAWVTQDNELFSGTIRENIAYGNRHAPEEEILEAARLARVTDFFPVLKDGLDTIVGDHGKSLSAGQRQRLALARAIVANPRILILDEATSQIDGKSEALVHASLKEFMRGRTTFIITHRRSSLQLADRVIVLNAGKIISDSSVEHAEANHREFQTLFQKSA